MKRINGRMPKELVRVTKRFKVDSASVVTIEAGPEGWTIVYYPGKYKTKDISATTSINFYEALAELEKESKTVEWLDTPLKLKSEVKTPDDEEEYNDVDYGDEDADFEPEDLATEDDEIDYGDEDS